MPRRPDRTVPQAGRRTEGCPASETSRILYVTCKQRHARRRRKAAAPRAIGNLLTNAVKYSPNGGEVRLNCAAHRTSKSTSATRASVFRQRSRRTLFDPFYRATNVGETERHRLRTVDRRQAIELHGGTLEIARSDCSGTEFVITLPVNEGTFLTGC